MTIDVEQARAHTFPHLEVVAERSGLRFFAKATGQRDPAQIELDEALALGRPDLPLPPTFFFSLELEAPDAFGAQALGVDERDCLHAEQTFTYHEPVYAGDVLSLRTKIVDVISKKGGALEFVLKETEFKRRGQLVATSQMSYVVRNQEKKLS